MDDSVLEYKRLELDLLIRKDPTKCNQPARTFTEHTYKITNELANWPGSSWRIIQVTLFEIVSLISPCPRRNDFGNSMQGVRFDKIGTKLKKWFLKLLNWPQRWRMRILTICQVNQISSAFVQAKSMDFFQNAQVISAGNRAVDGVPYLSEIISITRCWGMEISKGESLPVDSIPDDQLVEL